MTSRISLEIDFEGRECYLAPISVDIELEEYLKRAEREEFKSSSISMIDEATGRIIPCQFSLLSSEKLRGTISWIHPSHAHKRIEVIIGKDLRGYGFSRGVEIRDRGDYQLEFSINGEHVANYVYNEAYERPFLYPVIGPDGLNVVRHVPNFGDHPHHKGISIALGDVSGRRGEPGINFWASGSIGDPKQGRVIHQKFTRIEEGPVFGRIQEENIWKQNDELEEISHDRSQWRMVHGSR